MFNVLVIMGSPRSRGNTYRLTRLVEARMKRFGQVEFEYLFLSETNLGTCQGCRACFEVGEDRCPIRDDRASIAERIQRADGVIMATPVYVGNVSGLTKNFIDRFAYACHRPRFFKHVLAIATTGSAGAWWTLVLLTMSLIPMGFRVAHRLGVACGGYYEPRSDTEHDRRRASLIEKADSAAQKFYNAMRVGDPPVAGVMGMATFLIQKRAYLNARVESYDFVYWQRRGWLRPGVCYYYDPKASALKKALAIAVSKLLGLAISGR